MKGPVFIIIFLRILKSSLHCCFVTLLDPRGGWRHSAGAEGAAWHLVSLPCDTTALLPPHSETHWTTLLRTGTVCCKQPTTVSYCRRVAVFLNVCVCGHCSRAWRCSWTPGASRSLWTASYWLPLSLTFIWSSRTAGGIAQWHHVDLQNLTKTIWNQISSLWSLTYFLSTSCFPALSSALFSTTGGLWLIWQTCWITASSSSLII